MNSPQSKIDKIFAKTFAEFGPPFDRTELFQHEAAGLKEIRAFLRQSMSLQWRAYGENGLIHLDYIDNPSFNALATRNGRHELIAIYSGALHFIYRFWFFFMCDPLAMPHVGYPSGETPDPTVAISIRNGDLNVAGYQHPHDEKRYLAAQNFALATCLMLTNHEVGHIASCHPHYLQQVSPQYGLYEELPAASKSVRTQKLRQGMELEADEYAGGITFQCLHANRGLLHGIGHLDMGYVWSAASMALFLLIHNQSGRGFYEASATHPAPFDRWVLSLEKLLKSERCRVFNPDTGLIGAGLIDVFDFWVRHDFNGNDEASHSKASASAHVNLALAPSLRMDSLAAAAARINVVLKGIRKISGSLNRLGSERAEAGLRWRESHRSMAHDDLASKMSQGPVRRE